MTPLTDAELDGLIERLLVNNIAAGLLPPDVNVAAASALRSLRSERDALKVESDEYLEEARHNSKLWIDACNVCDVLRIERDALKVERDAKWGGVELLAQQRNEAIAERDALRAERDALRKECARLSGLINNPHTDDFLEAVRTEAAHQRERWASEHDAGKTDADWFWLIGYLAGKALNKPEKQLHHIITTAAACLNWHAARTGADTRMRPGIDSAMQGEQQK